MKRPMIIFLDQKIEKGDGLDKTYYWFIFKAKWGRRWDCCFYLRQFCFIYDEGDNHPLEEETGLNEEELNAVLLRLARTGERKLAYETETIEFKPLNQLSCEQYSGCY